MAETDVETLPVESNQYKAYIRSEELRTPWFYESYIWDYCEDEIISALKELEFYIDGTVYINYESEA